MNQPAVFLNGRRFWLMLQNFRRTSYGMTVVRIGLSTLGSQKQAGWFTAHHPNLTSISDIMCS